MRNYTALTIAGSDPSGGAGLQADLKTFHQFGVFGCSVVSLLTVQNSKEVKSVHLIDSSIVEAQLDAVLTDIKPMAIKTGALGSASVIKIIAKKFSPSGRFYSSTTPLIVDPVLVSTHKASLLNLDALPVLQNELFSFCYLVTPNIMEAELLAGTKINTASDMENAAKLIQSMGAKNVLIKGGHMSTDPIDLLLTEQNSVHTFLHERINTKNTHGTGCILSAAITANLSRGILLLQAVEKSIEFTTKAISTAPNITNDGGYGPINMFVDTKKPFKKNPQGTKG